LATSEVVKERGKTGGYVVAAGCVVKECIKTYGSICGGGGSVHYICMQGVPALGRVIVEFVAILPSTGLRKPKAGERDRKGADKKMAPQGRPANFDRARVGVVNSVG
jgi:hypothetical protein